MNVAWVLKLKPNLILELRGYTAGLLSDTSLLKFEAWLWEKQHCLFADAF